MSEVFELNVEEMNEIAGGYRKPAEKFGYIIYQIKRGDTLGKIARMFGTTQKKVEILFDDVKVEFILNIHDGSPKENERDYRIPKTGIE